MKQLIVLILCSSFSLTLLSQNDSTKVIQSKQKGDTTQVKVMEKNVITVTEGEEGTRVKIGDNNGVEIITDDWGDTTQIRLGKRTFRVIEKNNGAKVDVTKEEKPKKTTGSFNAHWAGLEFGANVLHETNYSLYNGNEFFDLVPGKSVTVNINFAEWAFKNEAKTFAVVTGLGLSSNDYTFDRPLTIAKESENGKIVPVSIDPEGLKKSKLNVWYFTAPMMLELKTPLRMGNQRLYLAGGVIGGLNIGSHTKVKYKNDKDKSKGNFNLNPFKYELTGRIGFGDFCIFANYSMSPLFKEGKGPVVKPLTIGFSFPNI